MKSHLIFALAAVASSVAFVSAQQCDEDQFTCDNGNCLPGQWECDSQDDCGDGSDERECPCDGFHCNSTGICIPDSWKCDYYADCVDGSDEADCPCDDGFVCSNGDCIPPWGRCDGQADCGDMGDEEDCPSTTTTSSTIPPSTTTTTEAPCFECLDGSYCVPQYFICDGYRDCNDNSDEVDCPCGENQAKCDDGRCINSDYWCDGEVEDCDDGSDELNCDNSTQPSGSRIHRTGLDKVLKLTRDGKLDKVKYQQKLRSQKSNKLWKSLGLKK